MRTVIIGGGAAGASAAARLRRLDEFAQIIILERTDEISIANCGLPYYASGVIADRDKMLVSNPSVFKDRFNIEVRLNSAVTAINPQNKTVTVNNEYELTYDKLILATGVNPAKPPIEGINRPNIFTVRNLHDVDAIKDYIAKNNVKNTAIIGGGFIGAEMAENFAHMGLNTKIIDMADYILSAFDPDISCYAQNQMRDNGVELILQDGVKVFEEKEILLTSGRRVPYDIVILGIGVVPERELISGLGLAQGIGGTVKVNELLETSHPDIYSAGDTIETKDFITGDDAVIQLAGLANRHGRIIADNIAGIRVAQTPALGAGIVKVFDQTLAIVGNTEKQLKEKNIPYQKAIVITNSHAGYYPNAFPLTIKLLFTDEGRILGAQAAGESSEKHIDIISTVIRLNGRVQELVDSELCYAPPYSSAKAPVNMIGMNAENILKGFLKPAFYEDLEDAYLIDVREVYGKTIEGSINLPVEEMRARMDEIPRDRKVVLFCNRGFQSYVAARLLMQHGFDNVYSLEGGMAHYSEIVKDKQEKFSQRVPVAVGAASHEGVIKLDACGLQCPGPIMKLASTLNEMSDGQVVEVSTTDAGFKSDIEGWCETTGNTLLGFNHENKVIKAMIAKGSNAAPKSENGQTIVVFSNDLDKALAAMIIANGAAASGKKVTLFFTFWGLQVIKKSLGANCLALSKFNLGGIGAWMMKLMMKYKKVSPLTELIQSAMSQGVTFMACSMSMDIMFIKAEELIDGVEIGGVAKYIAESSKSGSNLFI